MIRTLCLVQTNDSEEYPILIWNDFGFDVNKVIHYAREIKDGYTNIYFGNDQEATIAIKIEEFEKLINAKEIIDAKAKYEYEDQ